MSRVLSIIAILCLVACKGKESPAQKGTESHPLPDTLRVATLYSPESYFIYREEFLGYDYSLVETFVNDKKIALDLHVAPNFRSMIEMLDSGIVDLIAYEVPVTAEFVERFVDCGPRSDTYQVLVQPIPANPDSLITDETQLIGRDIYVEADSKYYHRLLNLDEELGGGIRIHTVNRDSIITEDLIEMVSEDSIPLTVVDNNIAALNTTYYPDIDVSLKLSFPQRSAWAVSSSNKWLADSIDAWLSLDEPRQARSRLLKRYFELSKNQNYNILLDLTRGHISAYDDLFKKHAASIDYDWRLLASQGWVESQFDSTRVSWAGAKGIMQVMPGTARAYGVAPERLVHPETAISTATRILSDIRKSLSRYEIDDPDELAKFTLAAYNSGIAHIYDAIALAEKLGYDPTRWDGNVAACLLLKSKPEYYNDPVCRFGYFRGRQTVVYVDHVMTFYDRAKKYINP